MRLSRPNIYCCSLSRTVATSGCLNPKYVNTALSGKGNFEKEFEKTHIKTSIFQKLLLGVGSGVISITSPSRGDMIAVMGEVTGYQAWEYIRSKMMQSEEGKQILEEKPRISSGAVDLEKLKTYPNGTLGKAYSDFLNKYGYSPDSRNAVQFVDDLELAYVAQRYREGHDLFHTLLNMPTNMLGEVTVKWVEAIQLKLPMCAAGALFGAVRLAPKSARFYSTKPVLVIDKALESQIKSKEIKPRSHSGVMNLKCSSLPVKVKKSIDIILESQNKKELFQLAKRLENKIISRQLPLEEITIEKKFQNAITNYLKKHPEITNDDLVSLDLYKKVEKKIKFTTYNWEPMKFDERECLMHLISRGPAEYSAIKRVFWEIVKRDENFVPKTLMNFGSGSGTAVWAAYDYWKKSLTEYYCVDSSGKMNELASMILKYNNPDKHPFINGVYYRQFLPVTPKPYNVVVSAFSFLELPNMASRLKTLTTLWNNTEDYLVLIENGTNAGFAVITEAREYILSISEQFNIDCYIFAPCPHEHHCPRLTAKGKKTPCNFMTKYELLKIPKNVNSSRCLFSYIIFKKGKKPEAKDRHCRIVREVLRKSKHVVCKLCTNEGHLKDVVFTKAKNGEVVYRCMRNSNWGDIVPGTLTWEEKKNRLEELYSGSSDESGDENDNNVENK